jgi:hypothetical protein
MCTCIPTHTPQVPVLIDPNAAPEPALGDAGATGEPQSPEGVVIRESAAILVSGRELHGF